MLARGKHVKHTTTITNPVGDSGQLHERITLQLWSDGSVTWSERVEVNNGREIRGTKPDEPNGGLPARPTPRPSLPRPGQMARPESIRPAQQIMPSSLPKPGPGLQPVAPYPAPSTVRDV